MTDVSVVLVTAGKEEEAALLARKLVEEELAACVNIIPRIRSIYRWKNEIFDEEEYLLVMKIRSSVFPRLQARVRELHSYEVPEIIRCSISEGLPEYLRWILDNSR
jgi:periplasmic divalent cation tolerance protein